MSGQKLKTDAPEEPTFGEGCFWVSKGGGTLVIDSVSELVFNVAEVRALRDWLTTILPDEK